MSDTISTKQVLLELIIILSLPIGCYIIFASEGGSEVLGVLILLIFGINLGAKWESQRIIGTKKFPVGEKE